VFSIELHEDDGDCDSVEEQQGDPDRKRMSHLSLFSCLSEDRKFASEDFLTPAQGSQFLPFSPPVLYRAVHEHVWENEMAARQCGIASPKNDFGFEPLACMLVL